MSKEGLCQRGGGGIRGAGSEGGYGFKCLFILVFSNDVDTHDDDVHVTVLSQCSLL